MSLHLDIEALHKFRNNPDSIGAVIEYMTREERREFEALLHSILWVPNFGPQTEAYFSPADELYYGGQVGGGKSHLLIGLAVSAHLRSVIFRREFTQTQDLIDESHKIIGGFGDYNGAYHVWRNLPGNRVLEFAGCKDSGDERKQQGRPRDFYGFDEIAEFLKAQYKFIIGWNRTATPGQRCRVVNTGNPPTNPEGAWIMDYWAPWLDRKHANPALPMELRYFATIKGEDVEVDGPGLITIPEEPDPIKPRSRSFIPASLDDNPFYRNSDYRSVIQGLPEPLRSRLLFGDYSIGHDDHPWQVIPTEWILGAQKRWKEQARPELPLMAIGIDPARGGESKTVLYPRCGHWYGPPTIKPGRETPDGASVARLALELLSKYQPTGQPGDEVVINIDIIGVGSSPYDACRDVFMSPKPPNYQGSLGNRPLRGAKVYERRVKVYPINAAGASDMVDRTGRLKMRNIRAAMIWNVMQELDPVHGSGLMIPDRPGLLADLTSYRWRLSLGGVILEDKEDQMARIGRSPDEGEAFALASWLGYRPKQESRTGALAKALRHRGV